MSENKRIEKLNNAIQLALGYDGYDPYIQRIKQQIKRGTKTNLDEAQIKYIFTYHDKEPQKIDKTIDITEYFGEQLKTQEKLDFVPTKIFVYYYFGSTENSHHVLGKLTKSQEPKNYFISKKQILGDLFYEIKEVNVDYSRYNALLSRVGRQVLPHQPEAVEFVLSREKPILADSMGMCKTSSSIIASIEGGFNKILIVCPASLKINWYRELLMLSVPENDIAVINGQRWVDGKKYTIINYDILDYFYEYVPGRKSKEKDVLVNEMLEKSELYNANFDLVIIDEAHKLSNAKSDRSLIVGDFLDRSKIKNRWLLTGTPITKRPISFYNLLKVVESPLAEDWVFYIKRYCEGKQITNRSTGRKIWLTSGSSNLEELHNKTKHIVLKRNIEDYIDMPDKIEIPQFYELSKSQSIRYTQLYDEFIEAKLEKDLQSYMIKNDISKLYDEFIKIKIEKGLQPHIVKNNISNEEKAKELFVNDMETLQSLMETAVIRKFLAMEMLPNTMDLIDTALEEGNKIIVFTNYTDELMELYEKYRSIAVIHYGEMTQTKKQASVDKFQNDANCKLFIGNIESAGMGLTLTEADIEIFNSMHWLPKINEQAICRSWRNGRKLPVTVYFNMFSNTKSEEWYVQNMVKTQEIDSVIK